MIPVSSNQGIFLHGIDVTKPVLEISELPVLPLATPATAINAGNAVYLTAAGKVALATTSTGVLGLAKSNMNTYIDETAGALGGIYGSGCMDVVLNGIVTLRPSVFFNVQGNVQAGQTTVPSWNADIVYNVAPGTDLYYDAAGAYLFNRRQSNRFSSYRKSNLHRISNSCRRSEHSYISNVQTYSVMFQKIQQED